MIDPAWIALVIIAITTLFLIKSRFNYLRLPELPVVPDSVHADVTVVIPARNEEANIARAVSSFPGRRVLVVDDDSSDGTAEVAVKAGAQVIQAPPLKHGMLGKPNACLAGARLCKSRWILFVDADTWYQPQFLPSLLAYAKSENLVSASVFLKQECGTFYESLLIPYAFALYFCGVNSSRVNDPTAPEALANGQCLLFDRNAYNFINGHKAAMGSVVEDVALARVMKLHRMRARVVRGEHLGSVRMYDGMGAIWRGFQKNSFVFLVMNPASGLQVIAASIMLTSYVPVLIWLLANQEPDWAMTLAVLPMLLLAPWYRSAWTMLCPLAIYIFQVIALNGMFTTLSGRKAIWKGRRV